MTIFPEHDGVNPVVAEVVMREAATLVKPEFTLRQLISVKGD